MQQTMPFFDFVCDNMRFLQKALASMSPRHISKDIINAWLKVQNFRYPEPYKLKTAVYPHTLTILSLWCPTVSLSLSHSWVRCGI